MQHPMPSRTMPSMSYQREEEMPVWEDNSDCALWRCAHVEVSEGVWEAAELCCACMRKSLS